MWLQNYTVMYIHYFSHQRLNNYCSNREKEKYVKKGLHGLFHNTEKKKILGLIQDGLFMTVT